MTANELKRAYTRDELVSILQKEGLPLSPACLRKAIGLGLIPRPRQVSAGRGKLRFEYSEAALAMARSLACHVKRGQSVAAFKAHVDTARIQGLSDALDILERLTRLHALNPSAVGKHASLVLEEVLLANRNMRAAEVQAWLGGLKQEICAMASVPSHNVRTSWLAWVARTREKLDALNMRLCDKNET